MSAPAVPLPADLGAATSVSLEGAAQVLRPPEPGLSFLRHDRAEDMSLAPGSLALRDGRIAALQDDGAAELRVDASGCALVPGLVDCHTHLPFAGWRDGEYARKIAGASYEEIARAGGGIASSARSFAETSDGDVLAQAEGIAREMLHAGTTTFETKSGYGLSVQAELRALGLAARLAERVPQGVVSTALLAHALPAGFEPDAWLDAVEAMLPTVVAETPAEAVDIYVESIAFTNDHLARLGALAAEHGLGLRAHVEQFATHRSVPVALEAGAWSVDHLSCLHPDDLPALAASECAAVLLPGAEFMGAEHVAPGRALADAGAVCVLATDVNPGTSPIAELQVIAGLAVRRYRWSPREALLALTLNAAWPLRRSAEVGSLEVGKRADVVLLDGPVERIGYRFARNPVAAVLVGGVPVHVRPDALWRFAA